MEPRADRLATLAGTPHLAAVQTPNMAELVLSGFFSVHNLGFRGGRNTFSLKNTSVFIYLDRAAIDKQPASCFVKRDNYYRSVLVVVQKACERVQISHDIVQLVIVQYRALTHPVRLVVFLQGN